MPKLTAIVPKGGTAIDSARAKRGIQNVLLTFGFEAQRLLQAYPPAQPWKNPPKSGIRKGGKRTGDLGKNWRIGRPTQTYIEVRNNTPYGSYVQGPTDKSGKAGGQTAVMAARGWPSVTDVGKQAAKITAVKADIYPD